MFSARLTNGRASAYPTMLTTAPHGDAPDTGMSPPGGVEETEASAEARGVLKPASP